MKCGRILLLVLAVAAVLLVAIPALPAAAAEGDGLIKAGDPTKDGSVGITITCHRANKPVEIIQVSVAILATDDATGKATKIENAIDGMSPGCFTTSRSFETITLVPNAGNRINVVHIDNDNTNETIGTKCSSSVPVQGEASFSGTATGGTASVSVGAVTAQTTTNGKTATQIMQALVTSLTSQGVGAVLGGDGMIGITDDLADVLFSAGNSDSGLTLQLEVQRLVTVGGLAELPGVAGSSGANHMALAGLAAGALVALTAGAWYARRRWVG
jgi:hypothetical protein